MDNLPQAEFVSVISLIISLISCFSGICSHPGGWPRRILFGAAIVTIIFSILFYHKSTNTISEAPIQESKPIVERVDKNIIERVESNNSSQPVKPSDLNRPRFINIPSETQILIFNASRHPLAHSELGSALQRLYPEAIIEAQFDWTLRWEMHKTRIYYMSPEYQKVAEGLADWFLGGQEVIDYYDQPQSPFPEHPRGNVSTIVGIDPKRNLIIFVGEDFQQVLSTFSSRIK